ncbi:MAG TPA: DUF87 domain-containing protein [Acidimicrobiia bacterium]|nr:DUF87 domain-containing protein [Acidimicrobiia bacterium]
MSTEGLYLGATIDAATGDRTDTLVDYDPSELTTHGVIVGMTGSGKTGLGVIFLEEALLKGIPTLILDPKGDMTNLLLTFPDLAPGDFEPWVDPGEARKEGKTQAELAADKAELWKNGLASWDQDGSRIGALRNGAGFTIYTPGSSAGAPLNIIGSLANPGASWDTDAEALRDEIEGFTSGLLGLLGIDADPISSREHILIANLVEHAWRQGKDLDLATLLAHIQRPPLRKLGVFDLDAFFPEKDRTALAMQLNGLLASPAFAEWVSGAPLDAGKLLWDENGAPQAAIVYLAHLSEEERQFIVTLILSKVVTWMRSQPGTGDLRAMVYMDEVFGFVPPTAEPPAKKPILTMLKQARAFGVGMLLSTQNPVDLDYKAMSNAGTWCIGRLQTEQDKSRIVEALQSARGDTDVAELDRAISGLGKRQFLLHNTREQAPALFTTRWALSYLAGPLTREQITRLQGDVPTAAAVASPAASPPDAAAGPAEALAADETPVMPTVAEGVSVFHAHPSAPWLADLGGDEDGKRHVAAVAARVQLRFDDRAAGLDHAEEWEAIGLLDQGLDTDGLVNVDYDDRDFTESAPDGAAYEIPAAPIDKKTFFTKAGTAVKEHLYRNRKLTIQRNVKLKLYSRPGETTEEFATRCDAAAQDTADEAAAKLRDKYETKIATARKQYESAERRVSELEVQVSGSQQNELMEGAGALLNILTGKRSTRSVTGSARRRQATRTKQERLRSAQEKAVTEWEEMAALETEMIEELEEINDEWEALATEIEEVEVPLEKTDIHIEDLALVWIPVSD